MGLTGPTRRVAKLATVTAGDNGEALDELLALADQLLEEASAVRRQWAELGQALGIETQEAPADPVEAQPKGEVMRLVALDMMLSGRPEEDAREHLRSVFGPDADASVVDDVYRGPLAG